MPSFDRKNGESGRNKTLSIQAGGICCCDIHQEIHSVHNKKAVHFEDQKSKNRAVSWLKTHNLAEETNGRWILLLNWSDLKFEQIPCTKHKNAD